MNVLNGKYIYFILNMSQLHLLQIHILIYTSQSNRTKIQALVEFREGFQSRLSPLCSQRLCRRGRWCLVEFPGLCANNLCLGRDFPESTMCRGKFKEKVFHFLLWYSGEWGVSICAEASAIQPGEHGHVERSERRIVMMKWFRMYLFYQVVFYAKYSEIRAALERLQKLKD